MRRLSPLSVPYRVVQRGGSLLFPLLVLAATGGPVLGDVPGVALGLLAVAGLLAFVAYEMAYYQRYGYELTADTLDIHSGVFTRRDREIPLRRVQNVDASRNAVQRALGIAAVRVETAGGSETEAVIRFVSDEEARRLQQEVARLKRGAAADEPDPEAETLFALAPRELAIVGALSFDSRVPGFLLVLLTGSVPALSVLTEGGMVFALVGSVSIALLVAVAAWGVGAAATVANYYGFVLRRVGDDLRYERGLIRRYEGTIPLEKVQTLTVRDDPVKRRFGYASLAVETAGYAPGEGPSGGSEAAVPLARRDRVWDLVESIEGVADEPLDRPPRRMRRRYLVRYTLGVAALTAVLIGVDLLLARPLPWYAPLALLALVPVGAHLTWLHRGRRLGADHFRTRNGVLKRETRLVRYSRIQTVIDSRSLLQRRWGVATVTADTAGSLSLVGGDASAVDVEAADAESLREGLAERLQRALAARTRDRG